MILMRSIKTMPRILKWFLAICGSMAIVIILAVALAYMFVDERRLRPAIEKMISGAAGCPVTMGEDIDLSLFPWVGVSISELRVENPEGFTEKRILTANSFKVKVKLLPLFSGNVQVHSLVLDGPRIFLERNRAGRLNWKAIGPHSKKDAVDVPKEKENKGLRGFSLKSLNMLEVAVTNGTFLWIDNLKGKRHTITEVTFRLQDLFLGKPTHFVFSGRLNRQPITIEGNFEPFDKESVQKKIPLELSIRAMEQLKMKVRGEIKHLDTNPQYDLAVQATPFSPRKLMSGLGLDFPIQTSDPEALNRMAFHADFKGDFRNRLSSSGEVDVDGSRLRYVLNASDISRPDVAFDLDLDRIDLNRYLPLKDEKKALEQRIKSEVSGSKKEGAGFSFLGRVDVDGSVKVGRIRVKNLVIKDTRIKIAGKEGRIGIDLSKTICPITGVKEKTSESETGEVPFRVSIHGELKNFETTPQYKLDVQATPFSPRKLMSGLRLDFPIQTSDPEALNRMAFHADFKGDFRNKLSSSGEVDVDGSRLRYTLNASDISRPDVTFDLDLDRIDLNRYLPPEDKEKRSLEKTVKSKSSISKKEKKDFSLLTRSAFNGLVKVGRIRVKNLMVADSLIKISGKDGRIGFDLVKTVYPIKGVREKLTESGTGRVPFKISMHGKIQDLDTKPQYAVSVEATPFSPRTLMTGLGLDFPIQTSDPEALNRMAFHAEFKGDFRNRLSSSGEVDVDGSRLRYALNASDISRPDVTFDIDLDRVNLDRYLPPDGKHGLSENRQEPNTSKQNKLQTGHSILHQSQFNGLIKVGRIQFKNLQFIDFLAKVSGKRGHIILDLEKLACLSAMAKGKFSADLTGPLPIVRINSNVKEVRIERFLKELEVKGGENIEGVLDLSSDLTVQIQKNKGLKESIDGYLSVRSRQLLIHNLDLDKILKKYEKSQSFGLLDIGSYFVLGPFGPLLTKAYDHASTIHALGKGSSLVTSLVSDWKLSGGIALAEDVAFSTEMNRVAVKGKIDIPKQTFNNLKVAIIDKNGCVKYIQTINGDFSTPEIEKASFVVGSIVRPIASLLKKSRDFITRSKCKVFYNGKVLHPLLK